MDSWLPGWQSRGLGDELTGGLKGSGREKKPVMEKPSSLELFLRRHQADGSVESSGAFTLAREKALAKLAAFQLPFAEAWAVKIIQAIVARGSEAPIQVYLSSIQARFYFALKVNWSLDAVEESFFDPDVSFEDGADHLVNGLWALGFQEKRGFHLVLEGQSDSLLWNGQELVRLPMEPPGHRSYLEVSHQGLDSPKKSWLRSIVGGSARNAEIAGVLSRYCFTCPLPLEVDTVRVDSLQLCPNAGWAKETYPISLSFSNSGLPSWPIPEGTFLELPSHSSRASWDGGGLRKFAKAALKGLEAHRLAGIACMLSVHLQRVKSGDKYVFETSSGPSRCYWVADGAVVDQELFRGPSDVCSVGIFVSAEGLDTDLTNLRLQASSLKAKRKRQAGEVVARHLDSLRNLDMTEFVPKAKKQGMIVGGLCALLGLGTMLVIPGIGVLCLITGIVTAIDGASKSSPLVTDIPSSVRDLQSWFEWRYPPTSLPAPIDDLDW